jgi:hypothetical protein
MNCPIPRAAAHGGLPRKAAFSGLGSPEDEVQRRLDLPPRNDPTASITPALGRLLRAGHGRHFPKPRTARTGTKPDRNTAQRIGSVDVRERTRCPQRRAFGEPVEELSRPLAGNPAYVARADQKPFQRSQPSRSCASIWEVRGSARPISVQRIIDRSAGNGATIPWTQRSRFTAFAVKRQKRQIRAGMARPFIDGREQMPVEGFEMDGVKIGQILYRQRKGPDRITIRA